MPALDFGGAHALLPDPVTRQLIGWTTGPIKYPHEKAITACFYPDIVVVDGWASLPGWLTGLEYSRTVPRDADALYDAIAECLREMRLRPAWQDILTVIGQVDAALAQDVQRAIARSQDRSLRADATLRAQPEQDIEALLQGFAICHPVPHVAYTRGVWQARRTALGNALKDYLKAHGRLPDGEITIHIRGEAEPVSIDCAVLRQACEHGQAPDGIARAFFQRQPRARLPEPNRGA